MAIMYIQYRSIIISLRRQKNPIKGVTFRGLNCGRERWLSGKGVCLSTQWSKVRALHSDHDNDHDFSNYTSTCLFQEEDSRVIYLSC